MAPRRRRAKPKARTPKVQPLISKEEMDERRAILKRIAGTSRMGRPPIYETPDQLQEAIDSYFTQCEDKGHLPTVAGLQYHIGMYSADFWNEIARRSPDFSNVANGTKLRMLDYKFQAAASGAMDRSVFIFDAVNHHNHVNTRTENKNDNRNTGRVEIEAISISLVPSPPLPAADTRPVIDCAPSPMIEHNEAESDDLQ